MWPYNDDEAGWLAPDPIERERHRIANDNKPERKLAVVSAPDAKTPITRKPDPAV